MPIEKTTFESSIAKCCVDAELCAVKKIKLLLKCQNCHVKNGRTDVPVSIIFRVASLFTRYLTAIGIIPESLSSIGKF